MITLKETLKAQGDLYRLCKKRGNPNIDAFRGNGFYGVADIYKTYAQYPLNKPLNGIVPHGVSTNSRWLWNEEVRASVPYIYCYPKFREEVYRKRTNKRVISSASPYAYVVEMMKKQEKPPRQGTIFFPAHSSKQVVARQDYGKLADILLTLPEKYHPVDICIYWKDFLLGAAKPFKERGYNVVSCGHRYDRQFLYRLYHILSQYSYISGNSVGSYLFYGIRTGCTFFYLDFEYKQVASPAVLRRNGCGVTKRRKKIVQTFKLRVNKPTPKQLQMVNYYLGLDYLKTRKNLKKDLMVS